MMIELSWHARLAVIAVAVTVGAAWGATVATRRK